MSAPTQDLTPPQVRWDLSALYSGIDDPRIEATWKEAHRRADAYAAKYRGKINAPDCDAARLLAAIQEIEAIHQDMDKPAVYANLLFAADCADPKIGSFLQSQMEKSSSVRVKLMFAELELQAMPEEQAARLVADPLLANYSHFIQVSRAFSPHRLSEVEEVLLEEVANTGSRAWVRLFEEVTGNHVYRYRAPGSEEVEEMTQEEVLNLLRDPSRDVRQAAADAFSEGLASQERVLTFIYNNLLQDKNVEDRLRKHAFPEHSRHLANELAPETVALVVELCKQNYGLVERYYRVKRKMLGLPELTHIDRYAPLFDAEEEIPFEKARSMVLEAFGQFSEPMAAAAQEFFDKSWIDAEPRTGKTGGAFCGYVTPDTHPVVFMSYLNKMSDVGTLAHELGHGVHASFSRAQTYLNFHGTLPLAELASIFGEMLVFEKLVAQASHRDQLALYAEKIEGAFASVFRQVAMYSFEQRCHRERRESGELAPERFGEIWQEELQAMFGESVQLGEQHRRWWSYVGHFIFAPFYVYAYAFGELLTMSLYQKAKLEGPAFADKYIALLKLGGSRTPQELMDTVGVDLNSREFWLGGLSAIEGLVSKFEDLSAQ